MNLLLTFLLLAHTISPQQAHLNAVLARAAVLGDTQKMAVCLRGGANVNTYTLLYQTPLELAVEYHHYDAARLLLDNGAHINSASGFGTPLTWAVQNGDVALTRLLLDRGAWVDYGGQTATPLSAVLLFVVKAQAQPESNMMDMAVEILPNTPHNRRLAQLFRAKELEQYRRQYSGFSPGATEHRRACGLQTVRLLLSHGADVNRKGGGEITPLMECALAGSAEAAQLLLDKGAAVDAKDESGMTSLFYASMSGSPDLVKLLINKGADANAQRKDGSTALFYAVEGQNAEMVQSLLTHGANPNLSPSHSETLLGMAKRYGNPKIIILLQNAGAKK